MGLYCTKEIKIRRLTLLLLEETTSCSGLRCRSLRRTIGRELGVFTGLQE